MQSTTSPSPLSMRDEDYSLDDYIYDNESNLTDNDTSDLGGGFSDLPGSHIFLPTIYYLIFFTGFWGNIFVIVVVGSKGKRAGRLVDIFVLNLAMADLVFVLTLPLWAISSSQTNGWDFGFASEFLCKLSTYIISVNRFSNIFFLTCMSIDRYLAIVKMMDSRYLRSSKCVRITCAALWIISGTLGIPSLIYRKVAPSARGQSCQEDDNLVLLNCMYLGMVFLTFIFPVLIILVCYGTIIMHLNRHCAAAGNVRAEARRRHSLKMVLCIIVAFVASWLPYNTFRSIKFIFYLSESDLRHEAWLHNGFLFSCCLAFLNSCVNPAIYFFLDHHFRRRAKFLLQSCVGKTKMLQSFNSSASLTNPGTSETYATNGGRTQIQMSLQEENKSFITF